MRLIPWVSLLLCQCEVEVPQGEERIDDTNLDYYITLTWTQGVCPKNCGFSAYSLPQFKVCFDEVRVAQERGSQQATRRNLTTGTQELASNDSKRSKKYVKSSTTSEDPDRCWLGGSLHIPPYNSYDRICTTDNGERGQVDVWWSFPNYATRLPEWFTPRWTQWNSTIEIQLAAQTLVKCTYKILVPHDQNSKRCVLPTTGVQVWENTIALGASSFTFPPTALGNANLAVIHIAKSPSLCGGNITKVGYPGIILNWTF
eukprot:Gregarina_sp_Pseudo_9__4085@NODE_422_length_2869_cov_53_020141_g399_i0_p1_GENE_NODE_422_length_2869_cov_53_020141_g399_i0NODE_422_length_2869_cov_53_020141_g399_i0_p1_ORF_typecomplete_len258_score10_62_NODE_422_length_2869_cov_53_020141_g399_i012982071